MIRICEIRYSHTSTAMSNTSSVNPKMSNVTEKDCIIDPAAKLSGLQNAVVGSLAGMTEVLIQQPTIAIKNAIQVRVQQCIKPPDMTISTLTARDADQMGTFDLISWSWSHNGFCCPLYSHTIRC